MLGAATSVETLSGYSTALALGEEKKDEMRKTHFTEEEKEM